MPSAEPEAEAWAARSSAREGHGLFVEKAASALQLRLADDRHNQTIGLEHVFCHAPDILQGNRVDLPVARQKIVRAFAVELDVQQGVGHLCVGVEIQEV